LQSDLQVHRQAVSHCQEQNQVLLSHIEQQKLETLHMQELLQEAQKQMLLAGLKKPTVKRSKHAVSLTWLASHFISYQPRKVELKISRVWSPSLFSFSFLFLPCLWYLLSVCLFRFAIVLDCVTY
jgi:hypothetical protein